MGQPAMDHVSLQQRYYVAMRAHIVGRRSAVTSLESPRILHVLMSHVDWRTISDKMGGSRFKDRVLHNLDARVEEDRVRTRRFKQERVTDNHHGMFIRAYRKGLCSHRRRHHGITLYRENESRRGQDQNSQPPPSDGLLWRVRFVHAPRSEDFGILIFLSAIDSC